MTIEEAIEHCWDEAEKNRSRANAYDDEGQSMLAKGCNACAVEHAQMAAWLIELKQRREAEITAPPKSNADRIRQMTDEELAAFLDIYDIEDICRTRCAVVNYHDCMAGEKCKTHILEWLKQEVSEDAGSKTN